MIGYLRGRILDRRDHNVLLLVGDVGYEIAATSQWIASVTPGEDVELFIHTHVREDDLALFGFSSPAERDVFRKLISVSGVGPKLALAVLATLGVPELLRCVRERDVASFKRVPGIGAKKGEKLLIELGSKFDVESTPEALAAWRLSRPMVSTQQTDLAGALVQLGYRPAEFQPVIGALTERLGKEFDQTPLSDLVRTAIQQLSRNVMHPGRHP